MTDEDYLAVIGALAEQLRAAGAGDIANERNYLIRDPETGDDALLPPRDRLLLMLAAFERFLAIQDRATYERAVTVMGRALKGPGPERIELRLASDGTNTDRAFDFMGAPDLKKVRENVKRLIGVIQDTDRSPDSERTS